MNKAVRSNSPKERAICHPATSKGILAIIVRGEINGIKDNTVASVVSGLLIITKAHKKPITIGMVARFERLCTSASESALEAMQAKIPAYIRRPRNRKPRNTGIMKIRLKVSERP